MLSEHSVVDSVLLSISAACLGVVLWYPALLSGTCRRHVVDCVALPAAVAWATRCERRLALRVRACACASGRGDEAGSSPILLPLPLRRDRTHATLHNAVKVLVASSQSAAAGKWVARDHHDAAHAHANDRQLLCDTSRVVGCSPGRRALGSCLDNYSTQKCLGCP